MFGKPFGLFKLSGFEVKLDPSWFLIAALIVWTLTTGYFPRFLPGAGSGTYLVLGILAMLGLFGSLILHELSHSIVARRLGVRIGGITLFLFGGVAELKSEPKDASSELAIAAAGPAASMGLALGFWFLGVLAGLIGLPAPAVILISYLATVNFILAVFNLLPAFPLDGGRIYRAYLWRQSGDILEATRRASVLGSVFAWALIILGVVGLVTTQSIAGLWEILIGLFLLAASQGSYRSMLFADALNGKTVAALMTRNFHAVPPDQPLDELVDEIMLPHSVSFVPVVEDGQALGFINSGVVRGIDRENWPNTQVGDVFVEATDANTLEPDTLAVEVLDKISRTGNRKFLVVKDGRLVGVITLADLTSYLALLQSLGAEAHGHG